MGVLGIITSSTHLRLTAETTKLIYIVHNYPTKTTLRDVGATSSLFWHRTNLPVPGWAGLSSAASSPPAGTWSSCLCAAASRKPQDVWSGPIEHCLSKLSQQHHHSHN